MAQFKCSHCGGTFDGVPKFCPHCGSILTNSEETKIESKEPVLGLGENKKEEPKVEEHKEVEKPNIKIEKEDKPVKEEKIQEVDEDMKKQKVFVIVGFSLAMLAIVLLGMIYVDIYYLKDLDMMIRVIALPSLSLLAWIVAGIGNIFLNKGDEIVGGLKVMRIFGKIFAIIALWVAVLATVASALITVAYFASGWVSTFIDLDMKALIEEFLTTGKVTIQ